MLLLSSLSSIGGSVSANSHERSHEYSHGKSCGTILTHGSSEAALTATICESLDVRTQGDSYIPCFLDETKLMNLF